MAGLATQPSKRSATAFIDRIDSAQKREDGHTLLKLISEITGQEPVVWGNEKAPDFIIGFGKYTYTRKGGKEEFEWFNIGFAPRKSKLTLYVTFDLSQQEELLAKLGKCSFGKGCLYINKLADVDLQVLSKIISKSKDARWH